MLDKYKIIKEGNILAKQTSGGLWYCSELPAKTPKELDELIGEVNRIFNKYNEVNVKKKEKIKPKVKGME